MFQFKWLRWIIYLLPALGLFWVLFWRFFPYSTLAVSCSPSSCSRLVEGLTLPPEGVYRLKENGYWLSLNDGVTFDTTVLKPFRSLDVILTIPTDYSKPIQVGLRSDKTSPAYYQLLFFELSDLYRKWNRLEEEDRILFYRKDLESLENIDDFLNDLPPLKNIAQFSFDFRPYYKVPGYVPDQKETIIDLELLGDHRFLTYVKDEPLEFSVSFYNQLSKKQDTVEVAVAHEYGDREEIFKKTFPVSDGKLNVRIDDLREGTYSIVLDSSSNVVFNEFKTRQNWIFFDSHIQLAKSSPSIVVYSTFNLSPITIPAGGVLQQIGGFALLPSQAFVPPFPEIPNVQDIREADMRQVNYLLVRKPLPKIQISGDDQKVVTSFDDIRPYLSGNRLTISLESQGEAGRGFRFKEVELKFKK